MEATSLADDVASLGLAVDSSQVAAAAPALDRLSASSKTAESAAQRLGSAQAAAATQAQRFAAQNDFAARSQQALAATMSQITSQIMAMGAGLGVLGVAAAAMGTPWLVAAAAIKTATDALNSFREIAAEVGQKSLSLRQFAESTGLMIDQVRFLKKAGAEFGLTADEIEGKIGRFAVSSETAANGIGPISDALQAIGPRFRSAFENADTLAQRFDVLSSAFVEAKNKGGDFVTLLRDSFGRNSLRFGNLLELTQLKGGLEAAAQATKNYAGTNTEEISARAALTLKINEQKHVLDGLTASTINSTAILEKELKWIELKISAVQTLIDWQNRQVVSEKELAAQAMARANSDTNPAAEQITARARRRQGLDATPAEQFGPFQQFGPETPAGINAANEALTRMVVTQKNSLRAAEDAANATNRWVSALGPAATASETASLAMQKLVVEYERGNFGARGSAEAQERLGRAMQSVAVVARQLTATHDAAIQTLHARTAAEREAAAAAAVRASDSSGDAELRAQQAVTMEIEKQKAAHSDAMAAMQGQLAVAQAVTGAQKMAEQEAATYAELIRQGRTEQQALAEATKQTAIAQAQANAAVSEQIHSLEQETELIRASVNGTTELVKQRQAYENAIRSGAGEGKAQELVSAMREQASAQKDALLAQQRQAEEAQRLAAIQQQIIANEREHEAILQKEIADQNAVYEGASLLSQLSFKGTGGGSSSGDAEGAQRGGFASPTGQAYNDEMQREVEYWKARGYTHAQITGQNTNALYVDRGELDPAFVANQTVRGFETQRVQAQIAGDRGAEINAVQGELGFYRGQPQTLENLQQIKSLQDALKQLTDATNANTQAQTATLDEIYSSGHSARIGYYNEGNVTHIVGQPTIPTNNPAWGSVPHFAEGGTVTRPTLALVGENGPEDIIPAGKRSSPTVIQNFNINMPARSDLGDRTTQRQTFERIGRRAASGR